MRKLRLLAAILILLSVASGRFFTAAEEGDDWKTENLKLVLCKTEKEVLELQPASFVKFKMFYADGRWLDFDEDAKEKNYSEEAIGYPTKSTKYRGILVRRDKTGVDVDTNGDDKTDTRVTKSGTIVKIKARYPEREDTLAICFFNESKEVWDNAGKQWIKTHWFYTRAYYWVGKIAGQMITFLDDNVDGYLNVVGSDGVVIGKDKFGSYLSNITLVGNKLYEIKVDEQGRNFSYRPFLGKAVAADFASKFNGPVKPEFVVLRTPFERERPDPRSISIYLPKGKGFVPEANFELKQTRLSDRCIGGPNPREGQWVDDEVLPYIMKGKEEKLVFPFHPAQIKVVDMDSYTHVWGAPFCIHPKPYHETNDGGAPVDNLCMNAGDFLYFDSTGVCFYAPEEYESGGATLPEDLMFEILGFAPNGSQLSKSTRYTQDEGGNWGAFKIPLGKQRGVFKIQIKAKTKIFGQIDCFVDFKLEK